MCSPRHRIPNRRIGHDRRHLLALNRAFHGWGHQFLYNETLRASLLDAGFADIARCAFGESAHPALGGLERHEQSLDYGSLSHILTPSRHPAAAGKRRTLSPNRGATFCAM